MVNRFLCESNFFYRYTVRNKGCFIFHQYGIRAVFKHTVRVRYRRFRDFKNLRVVTGTLEGTADRQYVAFLQRKYTFCRPRYKLHIMVDFVKTYNHTRARFCNRRRFAVSREFDVVCARCAVFYAPITIAVLRIVCFRLEIECKTVCAAAVFLCVDAVVVFIHLTRAVYRRIRAEFKRAVRIRYRRLCDTDNGIVRRIFKIAFKGKYVAFCYSANRPAFYVIFGFAVFNNRFCARIPYVARFAVTRKFYRFRAHRDITKRPVAIQRCVVFCHSEIETARGTAVVVRIHLPCFVNRRIRRRYPFHNGGNVVTRQSRIRYKYN